MYIQGIGIVSPWTGQGSETLIKDDHFVIADPEYKQWIDLQQIRRMSRVVKMGVAAAHISLEEADVNLPDAIITGTAYGCMADTGIFLQKMVMQKEEMLAPTAFIQSTHNTLGGQIALKLSCHGYNNTFVHGNTSFESALLDTQFYLTENPDARVLTGSADEITPVSHNILSRLRRYKRIPVTPSELLDTATIGSMGGEGSAFFVLQAKKDDHSVAELKGIEMIFKKQNPEESLDSILQFLKKHELLPSDLSLLITGRNGDIRDDYQYDLAENSIFNNLPKAAFKHLCGEYPTAASFAMGIAAKAIQSDQLSPEMLYSGLAPKELNTILIWNAQSNMRHSLLLLQKC
jgi:3-oxoacyl-[acyl-carrier-protein] synthase II